MSDIINLESLKEYLDINKSVKINFTLIEDYCKMAGVRFYDHKNIFVKKGSVKEEIESIQALLARFGSYDTIAYKRMPIIHANYSYYQYFVIQGNLIDLKKALKISKLKAFL